MMEHRFYTLKSWVRSLTLYGLLSMACTARCFLTQSQIDGPEVEALALPVNVSRIIHDSYAQNSGHHRV